VADNDVDFVKGQSADCSIGSVGNSCGRKNALEDGKIHAIIRTVSRIIFGRVRRRVSVRSGGGRAQPSEIQR
jgi:hypothetical protein